MAGFIFGGNTPWTYDELKRQREIATALAMNAPAPSNVGEGLTAIGNALAYRGITKRANKEEARLKGEFDSKMASAFGGGMAAPSGSSFTPSGPALPPPDPNSPHALGDATMAALGKPAVKTGADPASIKAGLVARGLPEHIADGFVMNMQDESGLNPGINEVAPLVPGSRGGFGLYQLTGPRRKAYEAYAAQKGVPLDDVDAQLDFLMMELQGPEAEAWSKISGAQNAGEAGAAIVNHFLRPAEEHRAARSAEYLGGAPASPGGMDLGSLVALAGDPMISPAQKAIVEQLIAQQTTAADPMKAIELEKARLELEAMKNPTQDPMEAIRLKQAELDYNQDLTGGGVEPATYGTTLQFFTDPKSGKLSAGVIGNDGSFKPVDPPNGGEWAQGVDKVDAGTKFVFYDKRTGEKIGEEPKDIRGAEAEKAIGEAEGKSAVAAEGDIATADTTLGYIDSLRNHPGRVIGSGGSAYAGLVPGTNAKEFQIEVERLKSGAFLTAINELRGMGALSNAEGQTATAAIAALDPYGTEEGFLKRLEEYERIVKLGRDRAAKRAKAPEGAQPAAAPAADDGGWTVLPSGVKIREKP